VKCSIKKHRSNGRIWLLSWDRKDKDNGHKNIFGWRDKYRDIKINVSRIILKCIFVLLKPEVQEGHVFIDNIF